MAQVDATTYEQTFVVLNMDVRTAKMLKWVLGLESGTMVARRLDAGKWSAFNPTITTDLRSIDDPYGAVYRALETALDRLTAKEGK